MSGLALTAPRPAAQAVPAQPPAPATATAPATAPAAQAPTRSLAPLFSDAAVLQRDRDLPIWGTAAPGESVYLQLAGAMAEGRADPTGRWLLRLPPLPAGGPYELEARIGNFVQIASEIMIGDVWLASGQSNMEWPLGHTAEAEVAAAKKAAAAPGASDIRVFRVEHAAADTPQAPLRGAWAPIGSRGIDDAPAVAFWFAHELRREVGVPIGILFSAWGGTPAEAWTAADVLRGDSALAALPEQWSRRVAEAEAAHRKAHEEWERQRRAAEASGDEAPAEPQPRLPPRHHAPAALWNAMIAPLVPCAMRGVVWYQGESNVGRAEQYATLFPALIRGWRRAFASELPFFFVQIAPFRYGGDPLAAPALREAQAEALAVPRTGMVVTLDLGDPSDIHPGRKHEVGRRLALLALRDVYGREVVARGPSMASFRVDGDRVHVKFTDCEGGLRVRGSDGGAGEGNGATVRGFMIAGEDGKFVPAIATIEADTVVVRSQSVPKPTAVRYAFEAAPVADLVNAAGLPAAPFRTR